MTAMQMPTITKRHKRVRKIREAAQQLRAVGDGRERLELDERADDLGKAERGDGEIVTLELQDGQADERYARPAARRPASSKDKNTPSAVPAVWPRAFWSVSVRENLRSGS